MTSPTHGQQFVQPDDIVARIDALIPADEVHSHPLVWRARNIDLALLIDARNEIKRLRAGGCARNQLTQHCAEATAAHAEIERLRARVEVLEEALADERAIRARLAEANDQLRARLRASETEIERLRARVEVLELIRRYMGQGVSWDRAEEKAIDEIEERKARAALAASNGDRGAGEVGI
jgi:predicted RNase H-like nuclease (RuvC/YqgF family)